MEHHERKYDAAIIDGVRHYRWVGQSDTHWRTEDQSIDVIRGWLPIELRPSALEEDQQKAALRARLQAIGTDQQRDVDAWHDVQEPDWIPPERW